MIIDMQVELAYIGHIPPNDDWTWFDLVTYRGVLAKLVEQEVQEIKKQQKR